MYMYMYLIPPQIEENNVLQKSTENIDKMVFVYKRILTVLSQPLDVTCKMYFCLGKKFSGIRHQHNNMNITLSFLI